MSITGVSPDGTEGPQADLPLDEKAKEPVSSAAPSASSAQREPGTLPLSIKEDWQTLTAQRDILAQQDIDLNLEYLRRINPVRGVPLLLHAVEGNHYEQLFNILDEGKERLEVDDLTKVFHDLSKSPDEKVSVLRTAARDNTVGQLLRYQDWHDRLPQLRDLPAALQESADYMKRVTDTVLHIETEASKASRRGGIAFENR